MHPDYNKPVTGLNGNESHPFTDKIFYSTKDMVTITGKSRSTIEKWERIGKLPKRVVLDGGFKAFKATDLRDWYLNLDEA